MAKAGNFPWRFPGSSCGESREFRLTENMGLNATVIATQIPVAQWFDVIGDPTIADAVCDRIVPQAIRIPLSGISMLTLQGQRDQSEACAIPAT
jgi:hypothetical protein